jgi:hypothetical protein
MNCGPNCGWDRSKAERSGVMINIQWICTEKLTHERLILEMEQRTKSALTGGICYGTVSLPNATMIAKSPKTRSFIRFIIRDTTGFKNPGAPWTSAGIETARSMCHHLGPSRFPTV